MDWREAQPSSSKVDWLWTDNVDCSVTNLVTRLAHALARPLCVDQRMMQLPLPHVAMMVCVRVFIDNEKCDKCVMFMVEAVENVCSQARHERKEVSNVMHVCCFVGTPHLYSVLL